MFFENFNKQKRFEMNFSSHPLYTEDILEEERSTNTLNQHSNNI